MLQVSLNIRKTLKGTGTESVLTVLVQTKDSAVRFKLVSLKHNKLTVSYSHVTRTYFSIIITVINSEIKLLLKMCDNIEGNLLRGQARFHQYA